MVGSGLESRTAPIYIFLDDLDKYNYYSAKILVIKKDTLSSELESANVTIDSKYKLLVRGAIVIVYPKRSVTIDYPEGELSAVLEGSTIYLKIRSVEKVSKVTATNVTESTLGELMKKGVIKMWNPWKELPITVMLSTALLMAMSVVYSATGYQDIVGVASFAIAALTIIVAYIALAIWFANTIGVPS
jgi:hypothetical protein